MKKILFLSLAFFVFEFANAKPIVKSSIIHYKIYPKNKYKFAEQMEVHSPSKNYSKTRWDVTWNYKYNKKPNICRVTDLKVKLDIRIIMPQIPLGHWVKAKDRKAFDRFYKALLKHERGHERIANIASQEIERNLKNLRAKDCAVLQGTIYRKANRIIEKYENRSIEFDETSKHKGDQNRLLNKYL